MLIFSDYTSCIRFLGCSKLAINQKNNIHVTFFWYEFIFRFFWCCFVSLAKFRYWSKFHVIIITGSEVITIGIYKGLSRNPKIGNVLVSVFPKIWKLRQVRDKNLARIFLMKCYYMLQNTRATAFTVFELLRKKPQRESWQSSVLMSLLRIAPETAA